MNKSFSTKSRRVGIWLDIDWGLKRELEVYAGCHRYATEAGIELVLDPSLGRVHTLKPEAITYDGILGRATRRMVNAAHRAGVPIVNVWASSPVRNVPTVVPDFATSGVLAAEHLLGRGFRNFGFMGIESRRTVHMQHEGFRTTVERGGFSCSDYWFADTAVEDGAAGWNKFALDLKKWVSGLRLPTGVLVCEDLYCRFLINSCDSAGLTVPGDVSVVGTSNETLLCSMPSPSLTSMDMGHEQRGYRAAALLDEMIQGAPAPIDPILMPPPRLVLRQSSDVFAADDPLVASALRFMADNSHRRLKVGEVADVAGVSRRTLETRFRALVGRSINEEMIRLRVNRAKRRLAEPIGTLKTVAHESGFRTASYFTRVFTQVVGISPSEYRKQFTSPAREQTKTL